MYTLVSMTSQIVRNKFNPEMIPAGFCSVSVIDPDIHEARQSHVLQFLRRGPTAPPTGGLGHLFKDVKHSGNKCSFPDLSLADRINTDQTVVTAHSAGSKPKPTLCSVL